MIDHSKNCAEKWYDGSYALKHKFKQNEMIETEEGEKKIRDLVIGQDKIKTPSGHWKEVMTKEDINFQKIETKDGSTFIIPVL